MRIPSQTSEKLSIPLGKRRGNSDLARFSLDLTGGRVELDCAAHTEAYPSPPMSLSSPRPPEPTKDAGDKGQGGFPTTNNEAYRTSPAVLGVEQRAPPNYPSLPPPPAVVGVRPLPLGSPAYAYTRPEEVMGRRLSYPPQSGAMLPQPPQYSALVGPGPGALPPSYSVPSNPHMSENPAYTSPKSQRKTKGHVASACVPCKKAHLRCDAQRPCSRCLSNGKEDACVDVQHKKRGRPRLRDERDSRLEAGRHPHPTESAMRRPVSLYSPASGPVMLYDDPLRRGQPYKVLKSQPSDSLPPKYIERGAAVDVNVFPPPLHIPQRASEPMAFLTIDLEIAKASTAFVEAVGSHMVVGRNLADIVIPNERDRIVGLKRSLQEEQGRKEPNYLPPIYGKEEAERVIRSLPFGPEAVARFQLDRQEYLTFAGTDGQQRQFPLRVGLAKEDSIYLVAILLGSNVRSSMHLSSSPHSREAPYAFQGQPFSQSMSVPNLYDSGRSRTVETPRESMYTPRQPPTPVPAGITPGPVVGSNMNPSSASMSNRLENVPGPFYQVPRSELSSARSQPQPEYQLPPIRHQPQGGPPPNPAWREDRTGRVDIGGLIDNTDVRRQGR